MCVDYYDDDAVCYGDGRYYVYLLEDDNCNVFYIGSGSGKRFLDVTSRSAEFMEQYKARNNPRPVIIAYGMDKEESLLLEMRFIKEFKRLGFSLANKSTSCGTVTYNGVTRTYGAWGRDIGVSAATIKARIERLEWPLEKALFTPSTQDTLRKQMSERKCCRA